MKQRYRYNWRRHRWDGKLLSPEESVHLAALDSAGRDRFIAGIVASLQAKQATEWRRTARFRNQHARKGIL